MFPLHQINDILNYFSTVVVIHLINIKDEEKANEWLSI